MTINYDNQSSTKNLTWHKGQFYYLFVLLSQCTESGSVWSSSPYTLADDIRTELLNINNLELRGISAQMVRGNYNSLNIGVVAGFYDEEQNLDQSTASTLRANIVSALNNIARLSWAEIRIEITLIQHSTY